MVLPNTLPRTLKGLGGVRLFNIPGVIYPKEILVAKRGMNRQDGKPYRAIPAWGISTREAANLLGCTPGCARLWLHRRKVPYHIVSIDSGPPSIYWRRDKVESLANDRLPIINKRPSTLLSPTQAQELLNISRTSLQRYQNHGLLHAVQVRYPTSRGLRKQSYYKRAEVEQLARFIHLRREKESEIATLRKKILPQSLRKRPRSTTAPQHLHRKSSTQKTAARRKNARNPQNLHL